MMILGEIIFFNVLSGGSVLIWDLDAFPSVLVARCG